MRSSKLTNDILRTKYTTQLQSSLISLSIVKKKIRPTALGTYRSVMIFKKKK